MVSEIELKIFAIFSGCRGAFGGAELGEPPPEHFLEVINGLDSSFELSGEVHWLFQSGAIAGEELLKPAFVAEE